MGHGVQKALLLKGQREEAEMEPPPTAHPAQCGTSSFREGAGLTDGGEGAPYLPTHLPQQQGSPCLSMTVNSVFAQPVTVTRHPPPRQEKNSIQFCFFF